MVSIKFLIVLLCISFTLSAGTALDYSDSAQLNELVWGQNCNANNNGQQSPIDIRTNTKDYMKNNNFIEVTNTNYPTLNNVERKTHDEYHFKFDSADVTKGSMTIKKDGDSLEFPLANTHIHCGSEHRVNGKQYPCEIHMVHKRTINTGDRDQQRPYLVVGLLIEEGASNPLFDGDSMDYSSIVTEKTKFYYYEGGLTTPGCGEVVNWFVRIDPISASKAQLDKIKAWIATTEYGVNGNARNVKSMGNRKLYLVEDRNWTDSTSFLLTKLSLVVSLLALLFF
jgi:carbonic anhydrase